MGKTSQDCAGHFGKRLSGIIKHFGIHFSTLLPIYLFMSLLKDLYSPTFYKNLSDSLTSVMPSFNRQRFTSQIFSDEFSRMELKGRMKHTTRIIRSFMPSDFKKSVSIILRLIVELKRGGVESGGLAYIFLPDYIETYGIDDFEISMKAIEEITQFVSCEFAVRPFIIRYGAKMVRQMKKWSVHKNADVRRLATEGSRPRLPWAMAIPALKLDPSPILPILENLKDDPSESVRRSVANNLNDIAKDHPEVVVALAKKWKGKSKETDAIIRHGSRTLLKRGHVQILNHFGLKSKNLTVSSFHIANPFVVLGGELEFSFRVTNKNNKKQIVRLEYGLYYNKSNNQLSKKVFKISEKTFQAGESISVTKRQSFRKITTRIHYAGKHKLSLIVNGEEKDFKNFDVRGEG
jgi:3-methyladenine DNA glycosylase AlkC